MDKKVGKVFSMIREAKSLTLKDVSAGQFSIAQESKFERGETSLTIEKFMLLLQNSQISLDEFQDIYESYSLSEESVFKKELGEAHRVKDLNKIKKWIVFWSQMANENPNKKFYRLNQVVTKVALSETSGGKPLPEDINFLVAYLENVSQWGRYELWIFSVCQHYLDNNMLDYYGKDIFEKSNFYRNTHLNQQMVIRTMLNLIDTWLDRIQLSKALVYINHIKSIGINIEFFEESITLRYQEGRYRYLLGDKKGKEIMLDCVKDIEKYGYSHEATALYTEIDGI